MEFKLKTVFKASPALIYTSWLSSEGHAKMTGGAASITNRVGEKFTAWDGYIEGVNLALEGNKRIVQSWRTSDFEDTEEDSEIEILLFDINGKTELTLIHKNLPEHGEQYKQGWENHYFIPMKEFFSQIKD